MIDAQLQKILKHLSGHEERIRALEGPSNTQVARTNSKKGKQITLREVVKGRQFKNGQEQIAVIVGYREKELGTMIHKDKIKSEWINAKMMSKYSPNFLNRAKDDLIRVHSNGTCDLTQTGEEFFEKFLKNESTTPTSQ